jgi:hypothetical protein
MQLIRIEVTGFKTEVREFPKTKKGQAESVKYCRAIKKEFDEHPYFIFKELSNTYSRGGLSREKPYWQSLKK